MHTTKASNQITFEEKENTKETYNQDKSKILILNYVLNKSPIITYNYKIVDAKTKKELKKGVFVGDKIEWLDLTTLKCTEHVGIIRKQDYNILVEKEIKKANYILIKIE